MEENTAKSSRAESPDLPQGAPDPSANAPASEPAQGGKSGRAELPVDFYLNLLELPSCKTRGVCDNCGRCER